MPARTFGLGAAALMLALLAVSGFSRAQETGQAPAGPQVTIRGNVLCQRAFVPPLGTCGRDSKYIPVLIALDGTPEIKAEVDRIMKEYWPAGNTLDFDQARKLNEAWCERLTYHVAPFPGRDQLHSEVEYGSRIKAVTGVVFEKDGKKWITPTSIEPARWGSLDYTDLVPKVMFSPDRPLAKAGDRTLTLEVTDALSLKCILLPAGRFLMGSPFYQIRYQDEFPHEVVLTKPFYMSEIPITQEMFEQVLGKNPSTNKGPQFPVENVPFADIQAFCRILSEKNKRKVRLPTDAEFEYAARVGTSGPCFHEKYAGQFSHVAVKPAEGLPTQPIKTKSPNAWGLYDMLSCGWHTTGDYKMCNFRGKEIDPTGPRRPVQQYRGKGGKSEPLYKSRGGWFYGKVRPNQHGANKADGGYYEGIAIFRVVVEAEPDEIPPAPDAPADAKVEVKGPEHKNGIDTWVVTSDYQEKPCNLYVLLPEKFDRAKRYRVLYILPALGPNETEGIREAKKLGLADKHDLICVAPDFSRMPWYADLPDDPKVRYDGYLPDVIVPFIDRTYPTIARPEGRILVGFSKSGIGAVTLLLRHLDIFGRAGAWDAPLMEDHTRPEFFGPQEYFLKNYHIPTLLNRQVKMLKGKPARIAITGHGWGGVEPLHKLMVQLGIPHYYSGLPRSEHEWKSGWLGPLVDVLASDDMTKARPTSAPAKETK